MLPVGDRMQAILVPYVGDALAGMLLRAAASDVGKKPEELTSVDVNQAVESLSKLLSPIAPPATIQTIAATIEREVGR